MSARKSMALTATLAAILASFAGLAFATEPLGLQASTAPAHFDFRITNRTGKPLHFSGLVYAQAVSSKGDFYLKVLDAHGQPVKPCTKIDRFGKIKLHQLAPGKTFATSIEIAPVVDAFCLTRGRSYLLRVEYLQARFPGGIFRLSSRTTQIRMK